MTKKDLMDIVKNEFDVDDEKSSKLVFHYYSYTRSGKIISKYTKDENEWINSKERFLEDQSTYLLTLDDYTLKAHVPKRSFVEEDV
eukprot:14152531-Ditylum_brightwellii.AAC.1